MTDEQIRTMSPPKFIAKHWPEHLDADRRKAVEEFLGWAQDEHGVELCQEVSYSNGEWTHVEAPLSELLDTFFAGIELGDGRAFFPDG